MKGKENNCITNFDMKGKRRQEEKNRRKMKVKKLRTTAIMRVRKISSAQYIGSAITQRKIMREKTRREIERWESKTRLPYLRRWVKTLLFGALRVYLALPSTNIP